MPLPLATRILGIDPGLNTTGYGVIETTAGRPKIVEAGVVRGGSSAQASLALRVQAIFRGVSEVIAALRPTVLAMEELYSHYERPQTAILMGHARGVICLAGGEAGIEVVAYAATQVKRLVTGNGRATKEQIQLAVTRELGLAAPPDPPDVADALAIALSHWCQAARPELAAGVARGGDLETLALASEARRRRLLGGGTP